jgi:hypothetical protein
MSLSVAPLKTCRVVDPRVNFSNERSYAVVSGGNQVSWKPFTTNSFSTSAFNFSCPPPNPSIVTDARVYLSVPVTLNFTGTSPGVGFNLLQDGFDAFRAYPLSSICTTLTVTINNSSASINLSDIIPYITRYNTDHKIREYNYSLCPCMQDYFQIYGDGAGSVRNSLSSFISNSWETARGAFPMSNVVNTPVSATVSAVITEPIFLSPFLFGKGSDLRNGFIGVQSMNFQFTFANGVALQRIWSHDPSSGSTITNIDVNFDMPVLLFNYITPKLLEPIPREISYGYFSIDRFPTDGMATLSFGGSATINSNNIQLNTIPRRIYLFARKRNMDLTITDTDTFAAIESVSINYNNFSGLLSSATQADLYNISKKNGCNLSWPEWSGSAAGVATIPQAGGSGMSAVFDNTGATGATYVGLVGSILCIDMGIDIGLDDLNAPGIIMNSQLQITCTIRSINRNDLNTLYTFYIVTVSEGTWTIANLNSVPQIGILSREDVINSQKCPLIDYKSTDNIYGGNFVDKLKAFGRKALAGIKTALPYVKDVASVVGTVAPLLMGLGDEENDGGIMMGGVPVGGVQVGGRGRKGGMAISRSELHRRLQN